MFVFAAPLANIIASWRGYRSAIMIGSITAGLGLFISAWTTSINWLIITYGIITGTENKCKFLLELIFPRLYLRLCFNPFFCFFIICRNWL